MRALDRHLRVQLHQHGAHQARPQVRLGVGPGVEADHVGVAHVGELVAPRAPLARLLQAVAADLPQALLEQVQDEGLAPAPAPQDAHHQGRLSLAQRQALRQGLHLGLHAEQVRPPGQVVDHGLGAVLVIGEGGGKVSHHGMDRCRFGALHPQRDSTQARERAAPSTSPHPILHERGYVGGHPPKRRGVLHRQGDRTQAMGLRGFECPQEGLGRAFLGDLTPGWTLRLNEQKSARRCAPQERCAAAIGREFLHEGLDRLPMTEPHRVHQPLEG